MGVLEPATESLPPITGNCLEYGTRHTWSHADIYTWGPLPWSVWNDSNCSDLNVWRTENLEALWGGRVPLRHPRVSMQRELHPDWTLDIPRPFTSCSGQGSNTSEWRLGLASRPFPASPLGSAPCRVLVLRSAASRTPSPAAGSTRPGLLLSAWAHLSHSGTQHEEAAVAAPLSHTLRLCLHCQRSW